MAALGSKTRPIILRVQDDARAEEVSMICDAHGFQFIVGIEPDKPENLFDLKKALKSAPVQLPEKPLKVSPNDYCPCGSNKKYKNCCGAIPARA